MSDVKTLPSVEDAKYTPCFTDRRHIRFLGVAAAAVAASKVGDFRKPGVVIIEGVITEAGVENAAIGEKATSSMETYHSSSILRCLL